ncbi:MAG: TIM barrel protein, partial [Opitutaceae bacterium]|nr:TIM barrel protein [Opitutaceae bacterium]
PIAQLRQWAGRVFHVHGKDASLYKDIIARDGVNGPRRYFDHRHPGFGDTNWTDVISILRASGYSGTIDIEGWHDPVYKDELEMTGQVHALRHLRRCRGGEFVPNPTV